MLHMDQDLLNGALIGEWAEISPLWNWQYTRATMLFEAMEGAHVVHFIGAKKPWTHDRGAASAAVPRRLPGFLRADLARTAAARGGARAAPQPAVSAGEC